MCLIIYHKDIKNVSFPSCSLATTSLPHPRLQFRCYFIYFLCLCASVGGKRVRGHLSRTGSSLLLCWGRGSLVSAVWDVLHRVVYSRPVNFRWLPWSHLPSPLRSSGITDVYYQKLYMNSRGQTQVIRPAASTSICEPSYRPYLFFLRHRSLYPWLTWC